MITKIKTPEALNHDLVGGSWPAGLVPISVHFLRRTRKRRTNLTEAVVRLNKLPPAVLYKGVLYLPDPKTPGGPFQEKHTAREYVWIVKRWIKTPECFDPTGLLSIKPVAVCEDCGRVWTGTEELCPPCMAKGVRGAIKAVRDTDPPPDSEPEVEVDSEPMPDTQSSPALD